MKAASAARYDNDLLLNACDDQWMATDGNGVGTGVWRRFRRW